MRRSAIKLSAILAGLILSLCVSAHARDHGGRSGGHGGRASGAHHQSSGSHVHHYGHSSAVVSTFSFGFGYYPFPYYYAPYPRPVAAPPVYIERAEGSELPAGYWYYCAPAQAYYPDVSECSSNWFPVAPRPADGSGDGPSGA